MANPLRALNEHFNYNARLARALQQLLAPNERKMMQIWIDKLADMDKTTEQVIIRSDYMWFILLMMQSRVIRDPFNKLPPATLVPLKKFVPLQVYENVLIMHEPNKIYRCDSLNRNSGSEDSSTSISRATIDKLLKY